MSQRQSQSMRVGTVTLNPAIDQTVRVDHFRTNAVNRAVMMQLDAGGKGVNVASFLADYGLGVAVTGFLGQDNAEVFERFFASKHIEDRFVRLAGSTRIGVKIVDEANQQTTDINMPGLAPSEEAMTSLLETVEQLAPSCQWFALSGRLPPGMPASSYATMIAILKRHGVSTALDTSDEALREGLLAGPTIVKPNIEELQQATGQTLTDEIAVERAARQLLSSDTRLVVISMGEQGALFVNQEASLIATPPTVQVKSTVGAGDAMVAGLIASQVQGLSLAESARLATAFSLGAITNLGHNLPAAEIVQAYAQRVTIHSAPRVPRSA